MLQIWQPEVKIPQFIGWPRAFPFPIYYSPVLAAEPSGGWPVGYSVGLTDCCPLILHPKSIMLEIQCYMTWNQHFTDIILLCQRAHSNVMSNLLTIITFLFAAEHSDAFLPSSYRTTVEIVLVSGGQSCKFIPKPLYNPYMGFTYAENLLLCQKGRWVILGCLLCH